MSRRWYQLGGPEPRRWFTARRAKLLGGGVLLVLAGLLLGIQVQRLWALLPVVAGAGCVGLATLPAPAAARLGQVVSDVLRRPVARWGGWDSYDPSLDRCPFWLRGSREVSVAPGDGTAGEVGLLDHGDALSAVLEIEGDGAGIRPDHEHARLEHAVGEVLRSLGRASVPVSQVDVVSRAVPARGRHQRWLTDSLADQVPPAVRESMEQLSRQAEETAETITTYLVVRMPAGRLAAAARERGAQMSPETVPEQALRTVGTVSALLAEHGIRVRRALSPVEKAALVRSVWVPSHDADDQTGIDPDSFWAAWPRYDARRDATVATGTAGDQWWHATASVPRAGFPQQPVLGRWLEPLVLAPEVWWRLVTTKFRLLPAVEALAVARDQQTTAGARKVHEQTSGEVATGVVDDELSVGQVLISDVARSGQGGVAVSVHLLVTGSSAQQLARFRDEAERIFGQEMSGRALAWADNRHTPGVLAALPLGLEVT